MKKKLVIVGSFILAYILYAVLTGGIVLNRSRSFSGQQKVSFVKGLDSDLWLSPKFFTVGIPLLGFYTSSNSPYSLRIQIWDKSKKYTEIKISSVLINYTDGKKQIVKANWIRRLEPYTQVTYSGKIIKTPMMMLSDSIPNIINHHTSCIITLIGALKTIDGKNIPFEISEAFEYESEFRIYTYWEELASI